MNNSSPHSNRPAQRDNLDEVLSIISHWWIELVLLAPFVALGLWGYRHYGSVVAALLVLGVVVLVVAPRHPRRILLWMLHQSRVRRQLTVAFGATSGALQRHRPRVAKVERTPYGDRVTLRLARGTSSEDLERALAVIATSLRVATLRMTIDPGARNVVRLSLVRRDAFRDDVPECPLLGVREWSLWERVPVGFNEERETVTLQLAENSWLAAGLPGSGKSVALSVLVAAAALDPTVRLWLFDAKLVELAPWRDCAERFVGPDVEGAIAVLNELRLIMDQRYADLAQRGLRKVTRDSGLCLHVVVIDELALYVAGVDRNASTRFADALRDLVGRGRAAGIIVLSATQKPGTDTVPSSLRDLYSWRYSMHSATREASDTVLGSGWAARGFSATEIDPTLRGLGLLLHENGTPERVRSFHLTDDDVRVLAARARALRAKAPRGREGGESW